MTIGAAAAMVVAEASLEESPSSSDMRSRPAPLGHTHAGQPSGADKQTNKQTKKVESKIDIRSVWETSTFWCFFSFKKWKKVLNIFSKSKKVKICKTWCCIKIAENSISKLAFYLLFFNRTFNFAVFLGKGAIVLDLDRRVTSVVLAQTQIPTQLLGGACAPLKKWQKKWKKSVKTSKC